MMKIKQDEKTFQGKHACREFRARGGAATFGQSRAHLATLSTAGHIKYLVPGADKERGRK